jgi:DNA-binding MarR family transcriptional regulator
MGCIKDPRKAEQIIYAEVVRCATLDLEMTSCDDLADMLGGAAVSTTVGILNRLEKKGVIRIKRYQRSRQVYVVELDLSTREPRNKTPHWREQEREPVPSIHQQTLKAYNPKLAERVLKEAFKVGKTPPEFMELLVRIGFAEWEAEQAEQERQAA